MKRTKTKPARETDLYGPVRDYLVANGYTVRGEVQHCDIVASKGDDLIVIELKRQFNVDLLIQATARRKITESVYVALPRPSDWGARWRGMMRILKRLEIGLILVTLGGRKPRVDVAFHPVPYSPRKLKRARRAVLEEMSRRSGDYNEGGSTGRKLVTAYRENAIHIACALERLGPSAPRALRALGTGPKTLSILAGNVYGWFERVDRGVYALTSPGREGLEAFAKLADEYRAQIDACAASTDSDNVVKKSTRK
jgi:hypothetical protein